MAVFSHISKEVLQCVWRTTRRMLAAAVGFEPTELSFNGFQDRHLKPLGHTAVYDIQPECAQEYHILYTLTPVYFPSGVPTFSLFKDDSVSSWLIVLESNQRSWSQSPLPYHLANDQYMCFISSLADRNSIISHSAMNVNTEYKKFQIFYIPYIWTK